MVVAQAALEAADETQNPVDYYAGISALCVVILFAKFTTHDARTRKALASSGRSGSAGKPILRWTGWWWAHLACVVLAWFAIALSLLALGWGDVSKSYESLMRGAVAVLAGLASILLLADVITQA